MTENSNSVRCTNCALLFLQPNVPRRTRTARVEKLLHENHSPLEGELSAFRSDMDKTRAVLQDLDARIAQVKELLDSLFSARQQAQLQLEDAKSLLHPLRSIPSELLVEIFSHCVPRVDIAEDTDSLDPRGAPWLLTRVCRRWRELTINSPRLWTQLLIDFDMYAKCGTNLQSAHKARLFIERSAGLPMAVCLVGTVRVSNHWLAVLEKGIPRWRYMIGHIPPPFVQSLFERVFSNLRTLALQSSKWYGLDLDLEGFQPTRLPVLRELEVLSRDSWEVLEAVAFPWSHLTSVGNFPAFDVDGLNHLRMLTNLEDLRVDVDGYHSAIHTPIQDIVALPKLRRLTICEMDNAMGRGKEFFAALNIPALAELVLQFPDDEHVTLFPTSTSTLRNLTKLDLSCNMDAPRKNTQHLLDFLALTPRVEWLRVYDLTMTVKFVKGLNLSNSLNRVPVRLPYLLFLDIGDCECVEALADDLDPFVDMLYSRLPGVRDATKGGEKTDPVHQHSLVADSVPRSRPDSNFLKTVQLPRQVYVEMRRDRPDTFLEMSRKVKLECGVTTNDDPY